MGAPDHGEAMRRYPRRGGAGNHNSPVCSAIFGSGMSRSLRISFALVAACPTWQLLKKTNVFWVFWFRSRILSAHSLSSASEDRKSTRLNSSHDQISYAVFCLKKKKKH